MADAKEREPVEFLGRDYELKIQYLNAHFTRMWTRFNYFLGIETALVGGRIVFSADARPSIGLAVIGLLVAVLWYVMGAEDRYLVRIYRAQVERAGELVGQHLWPLAGPPYEWVGQIPDRMPAGSWELSGWRHPAISTTRMAALIPLLVALAWIGVLAGLGRA